jgi:chromosome condensin MukBEF ATPase and DNA-binding subunit MukB
MQNILGQIANPQIANIAQAIDIRQQRVKEQQDALSRVEMGRAIAKALPNLQEGSGFKWLAENDPEKFALVSKVLNIPLNDGDRFNQYASDVEQLYTLAQADPNQAYAHAQQLIESRKAQGQDTSNLEKWVTGMNEDPMKAMTSLFVMHRSNNPPKDDSMNEYQRESELVISSCKAE